jgi:hypothetical protein
LDQHVSVVPALRAALRARAGLLLGSIYVNYGITAALVTTGYMSLFLSGVVTAQQALWIVTAFAFVFPIWFFRYARSIWLGFDHYWDPTTEPPTEEKPQHAGVREPWKR